MENTVPRILPRAASRALRLVAHIYQPYLALTVKQHSRARVPHTNSVLLVWSRHLLAPRVAPRTSMFQRLCLHCNLPLPQPFVLRASQVANRLGNQAANPLNNRRIALPRSPLSHRRANRAHNQLHNLAFSQLHSLLQILRANPRGSQPGSRVLFPRGGLAASPLNSRRVVLRANQLGNRLCSRRVSQRGNHLDNPQIDQHRTLRTCITSH